jgi:hypothetical protein
VLFGCLFLLEEQAGSIDVAARDAAAMADIFRK